jgi:hypothetical protein
MNLTAVTCRSCGSTDLHLILSLGHTPLANALLTADNLNQPEATYPLDLVWCAGCSLVQITETVPPEELFSEYLYFSSFSDTMLRHAEALTGHLTRSRVLNSGSLVIEVASNDGYLLQNYHRAGIPVLGIEPATNIATVAQERGINTLCEFFGSTVAQSLADAGQRADVIHAHNVMAHVPDLNGFVAGVRILLKDTGAAVIEVPYVKDMIDHAEFDTIYHEHLCYFSLTALSRLFARHDLVIGHVERVPLHGGSLQVHVMHAESAQPDAAVKVLLDEESAWVDDFDFYQQFGQRVEFLKTELVSLLQQVKDRGETLVAYGASAKGSTLLNYMGIGRNLLDFVVDRSTYKQGRYTPGTHLPIYSPEKLLEVMPDAVLLLTWNFADEILEQQAEYRQRGGRFIIPIPKLRVV